MSEDASAVSAGRLYLDVVGDTTGLKDDLKAKLEAISQQLKMEIVAEVKVNADAAKAQLDEMARDREVTVVAKADTSGAKAELDEAAQDRETTIVAKADTAAARADLDDAARDRTANIKAKTDSSSLAKTISDIGDSLTKVSQTGLRFAGFTEAAGAVGNLAGALTALIATASQAAGVVGAIPGLLSAAAQGAGTVILGFAGVSTAVKDMAAQQSNATQSAYSMQQAQQAAADRVRTSSQALASAQVNAVQSVIQAQHNLQQAVTAVADAQYNAAQSVASGEHTLADAEYTEQQAQVALTQARVDATNALVNASLALRGANLDEAQATLNLQQAQIRLTQTMQSAVATPLMRQQAQLAVQQAQLALDQSKEKVKEAAQAKALADKQGVEGSQQVVAAKHAESDAAYQVANDEQTLARLRVTNARAIANAEYQQSQAQAALAKARIDAANQLQNAEISYREALQAARNPLLGVSSQTTALAQAMAKLSPAGREFVMFVHDQLMPVLNGMHKAVQQAFLPDVQKGAEAALPVLGVIQKGLVGTATVLGGVAEKFGEYIGSVSVRADISGVMRNNQIVLGYFGDALLHVVDIFRNVVVASEPMVRSFADMFDHLTKVVDAESAAGRESGKMEAFFGRAQSAAVLLVKILDAVAHSVAHIFTAAAPTGTSLLTSLLNTVTTFSKWTGDPTNQAKMQNFFAGTIPLAKQVGDAIVRIAKLFLELTQRMGGGQYNIIFETLNLILDVLNKLVRIPGLGPVITWILALSAAGVGMGKVASNITGIVDGLTKLTKIPGLSALLSKTGITGLVTRLGGKLTGKAADAGAAGAEDVAAGAEASAMTGAERAAQGGISGLASKVAQSTFGTAVGVFGVTAIAAIKGAFAKIPGILSDAGSAITGFGSNAVTALRGAFAAVPGIVSGAATSLAGFGARFGSMMAGAASSAATFVAGYAVKLGEAAAATAAWIAEHAVATAAFIAQNIAQAASATAAFVAENAATLGIAAAIALLVTAIVYLATHWRQVWSDVKRWAKDAWDFIWNGFGKWLLPLLGPAGLIILGIIEVAKHWSSIWNGIKSAISDVLGAIHDGVTNFVSGITTIWGKLESIFATPVKFVVDTVYDDGIAKLWNLVAGVVHLPKLPVFHLADGGRVPGHGTADNQPAFLTPGERVLSLGQVSRFGGGSLEAGHAVLDTLVGRGTGGPRHFGGGGIWGWVTSTASSIGSDITGGLSDLGGWITTGAKDVVNAGKFLVDALSDPVGTIKKLLAGPLAAMKSFDATPVGHLITSIPRTIADDIGHWVASSIGGLFTGGGASAPPGSLTGAVGNLPANYQTIVSYLVAHGFSKYMAAGIAGNIFAESGGNPDIWEIGGGGGYGLIQWTPPPPGLVGSGLLGELAQIVSEGMGMFSNPGSPAEAAYQYLMGRERPLDPAATAAVREASANAVYQAMFGSAAARNPVASRLDSGGPLPPGHNWLVNDTGRTEWVLTPDAVDLLGGPGAVQRLNMTARVHQGAPSAAGVITAAARPGTSATVNVFPAPYQTEEEIGAIAARKLGMMLS